LLEDFKQFLPESAAQAKAAAAAKAAEEAQQNQTPQGHGRNEAKLPPVGNFALPASSSKENKKRQRNSTAMNSASQANAMGESSHRGMAPGAATNKVRFCVGASMLYKVENSIILIRVLNSVPSSITSQMLQMRQLYHRR
jgi:histone deacetylase complex regulatory component SIN3